MEIKKTSLDNAYINPVNVRLKVVNGVCYKFNITLAKMLFMHSHTAQFGCTNWSKISGMRKQHNPSVINHNPNFVNQKP